jgi:hypothetical protein
MSLGSPACTANVFGPGVCNSVVVQRVVNAALSGVCVVGDTHTVSLNWTASKSPNVAGYNLNRGTVSGGPYGTKLNSSLVAATTYNDTSVALGQTYYYVATAVDTNGRESSYSNQAQAVNSRSVKACKLDCWLGISKQKPKIVITNTSRFSASRS